MRGLGAGCGLVKGDGGLLGTWGCLSLLVLAGDAGRRASITRGAIWLVIGVAAGLVGMGGLRPRATLTSAAQSNRAGLCSVVSNTVRTAGLAKGDGAGCALAVGSDSGSRSGGCDAAASLVPCSSRSPLSSSPLVSRSNSPTPSSPVSGVKTAVRPAVVALLGSMGVVSNAADVAVSAGAVMVVVAVVVTGWTLDWVRTGVRNTVP